MSFGIPRNIVAFFSEEAKFFDVALDLGFQFGQIFRTSAFNLLMIIEQNVWNVQMMFTLLMMSLRW